MRLTFIILLPQLSSMAVSLKTNNHAYSAKCGLGATKKETKETLLQTKHVSAG